MPLRAAGGRSKVALFLASGPVSLVAVVVLVAQVPAVVMSVGARGRRRNRSGRGLRRLSGGFIARGVAVSVPLSVSLSMAVPGRDRCRRGGLVVLAMPPDCPTGRSRAVERPGGRRSGRRGRDRPGRRRRVLRPGRMVPRVVAHPPRLLDGDACSRPDVSHMRLEGDRRELCAGDGGSGLLGVRSRALPRSGLVHRDDLAGRASDRRQHRDRPDYRARKEERSQPDRPGCRDDGERGSGGVGVRRLHLGLGRSQAALEKRSSVHKMYRPRRRFSRPDNDDFLPRMGHLSPSHRSPHCDAAHRE